MRRSSAQKKKKKKKKFKSHIGTGTLPLSAHAQKRKLTRAATHQRKKGLSKSNTTSFAYHLRISKKDNNDK
jgi:hypothetical protein